MRLSVEYNGEEVGFLKYYIGKDDKGNKMGYINYMEVLIEYRGIGIATCLLWYLYDILNKEGIKCVELDDCSDLYRDKNNIYLKVGAKYIEETCPEMIWKIGTKTVKKIREKYKGNNYKVILL